MEQARLLLGFTTVFGMILRNCILSVTSMRAATSAIHMSNKYLKSLISLTKGTSVVKGGSEARA